ncbi:MAG TPA: hypothetical protein DIW30_05845 [Bacteroidales bacterium]|nr:hypothetical protein [Bacteroidales bacterium]
MSSVADAHFVVPSEIQLLVFDLDGTLYNKRRLPLRLMWACRHSLSLLLAERKARKQLKGVWFGSEVAFYSALFSAMAKFCASTEQQAKDWYNSVYMPAMVAVLQRCYTADDFLLSQLPLWRAVGKRLAVYSDYGEVEAKLRAVGIAPSLFDGLFSAPSLGGLKPASEGLLAVLRHFGTAPCDALMIGDRPDTDGDVAKSIGVKYIQYKAK